MSSREIPSSVSRQAQPVNNILFVANNLPDAKRTLWWELKISECLCFLSTDRTLIKLYWSDIIIIISTCLILVYSRTWSFFDINEKWNTFLFRWETPQACSRILTTHFLIGHMKVQSRCSLNIFYLQAHNLYLFTDSWKNLLIAKLVINIKRQTSHMYFLIQEIFLP